MMSSAGDAPELIRVLYSSTLLKDHEISTIVATALKNNIKNGITGVLVYNEDTRQVQQVLEGPAQAVLVLLDKIKIDSRHRDMLIESIEPIVQVSFPEWSMGAWVEGDSESTRNDHENMHDNDLSIKVAFLDEDFVRQAGISRSRQEDGTSKLEDNLITVVYTSTLCHTCNIADVVIAAMHKNKLNGISGVLVYDENTRKVLQVLEGPAKSTLGLLKKLQADSRHTDMTVERIEPIEQLCFPNWSMRAWVQETDSLATRSTDADEQILARRRVMEMAFISEDCNNKTSAEISQQNSSAKMPLLTIVYTSTLGSNYAIDDIITVAVEKNRLNSITGVLVYNDETRNIQQIVEGPSDTVLELVIKIQGDSRHYNMKIQRIAPIRQRCFPQWSMQPWFEGQINKTMEGMEGTQEEGGTRALRLLHRREALGLAPSMMQAMAQAMEALPCPAEDNATDPDLENEDVCTPYTDPPTMETAHYQCLAPKSVPVAVPHSLCKRKKSVQDSI